MVTEHPSAKTSIYFLKQVGFNMVFSEPSRAERLSLFCCAHAVCMPRQDTGSYSQPAHPISTETSLSTNLPSRGSSRAVPSCAMQWRAFAPLSAVDLPVASALQTLLVGQSAADGCVWSCEESGLSNMCECV